MKIVLASKNQKKVRELQKIALSRQEQIHSVLKEQFRTAQTIRQQHMVMQE